LLLRVFYALHDSKTPALVGAVTMIVNVVTNVAAFYWFPPSQVVAALGAGFGLANLVGTVVAWQILSKRLNGMGGREIGRSLLKMHAAALPAALFALGVAVAVTVVLGSGKVASLAVVVAGGAGALVIYLVAARALRVGEVTDLIGSLRSRLGR
jgi:putative peptidoglycan lipid II flippase